MHFRYSVYGLTEAATPRSYVRWPGLASPSGTFLRKGRGFPASGGGESMGASHPSRYSSVWQLMAISLRQVYWIYTSKYLILCKLALTKYTNDLKRIPKKKKGSSN